MALANNADDVRRPTVTITRIDENEGAPHAPPQTDTVLYQSEAHWALKRAVLVNLQTHANTQRLAASTTVNAHVANLAQVRAGLFPTTNVDGNAPNVHYGIAQGAPQAAQRLVPIIQTELAAARQTLANQITALATRTRNLQNHDSGENFVFGVTAIDANSKRSLFVQDTTRLTANLVSSTIRAAHRGPFAFALPCTLRYMFNDQMLSWKRSC